MMKQSKPRIRLLLFAFILILQTPLLFAETENTERRISIGLRLFRMLLASDTQLNQKTSSDNQLNLLIVSSEDLSVAQHYADELINTGRGNKKGKIHGFSINISIIKADQLISSQHSNIAGIYIVEKLSERQLKTVIEYGVYNHIIVYSPFEGDVQEGILAGVAVGIQVRPFINLQTLKNSQLLIKDLFLKVAKIHED